MISNSYKVGIEREGLRTNESGELSDRPHLKVFGNRNTNAFVTTDFGAAQLELRTTPCPTTKECYEKLLNVTNVVLEELRKEGEYLWPYSMPCILPDIENFNFGEYGDNVKEHEYEMYLYKKYGYEMYCMSGVHLNFSINEKYYKELRKLNQELPEKLEDGYFKIIRNYLKRLWMLIALFGATPKQYKKDYEANCSIRNSNKQGFKNIHLAEVNYDNKEKHIASLRKNIKEGNIISISELYTPIRIKGKWKYDVDDLANNPISHIEVRVLDLNPFDKTSVTLEEIDFIVAFLFHCLLSKEDENYPTFDYRQVAEEGMTEEQKSLLNKEIREILKTNKIYELGFEKSLKKIQSDCKQGITLSSKVTQLVEEKGYIKALMDLAKQYNEEAHDAKYSVINLGKKIYDAPAALVRDAILRGVDYRVMDHRENNSIIEFMKHGKHEFIVGATQTRKDNYIVHYLTNDKFTSKEILQQHRLRVPRGIMINNRLSEEQLEDLYENYEEKAIVIKPRTTNGGVGITVFTTPPTKGQFIRAVNYAFEFDQDVLIEQYIKGEEYRFLVVGGKCISVINRRSAQVIGNGKSTIEKLIEEKNKEEWHVLLDTKIRMDSPLRVFLTKSGRTLEDIPKKGEIVKLRKNSNCSTGGESISLTDKIPDRFKRIAEKAAKAFESYVCGVDIIIDDLEGEEYAILETNADPGYDINQWPYEGPDAHIGIEILKMLGLITEEDEMYEE